MVLLSTLVLDSRRQYSHREGPSHLTRCAVRSTLLQLQNHLIVCLFREVKVKLWLAQLYLRILLLLTRLDLYSFSSALRILTVKERVLFQTFLRRRFSQSCQSRTQYSMFNCNLHPLYCTALHLHCTQLAQQASNLAV